MKPFPFFRCSLLLVLSITFGSLCAEAQIYPRQFFLPYQFAHSNGGRAWIKAAKVRAITSWFLRDGRTDESKLQRECRLEFDRDGRIVKVIVDFGSEANYSSSRFAYDGKGNLSSYELLMRGKVIETMQFHYGEHGLIDYKIHCTQSACDSTSYSWDSELKHALATLHDAGGRARSDRTTAFTIDAQRNLIFQDDPTLGDVSNRFSYEYDASGNLTEAKVFRPFERSVTTAYEYDERHRLVKVIDDVEGTTTYEYSPDGFISGKTIENIKKTKMSFSYELFE